MFGTYLFSGRYQALVGERCLALLWVSFQFALRWGIEFEFSSAPIHPPLVARLGPTGSTSGFGMAGC